MARVGCSGLKRKNVLYVLYYCICTLLLYMYFTTLNKVWQGLDAVGSSVVADVPDKALIVRQVTKPYLPNT